MTYIFHHGSTELEKELCLGVWLGHIAGKDLAPIYSSFKYYFTHGQSVCHPAPSWPPWQLMNNIQGAANSKASIEGYAFLLLSALFSLWKFKY